MPASMSIEYQCRMSGTLNERLYKNSVSAGYPQKLPKGTIRPWLLREKENTTNPGKIRLFTVKETLPPLL
jgi:hypothetical protein